MDHVEIRYRVHQRLRRRASNYEDCWVEDDGTVVILGIGAWTYYDMKQVSELLGTDNINVSGGGCESCGYEATIDVVLPEDSELWA
jgi:hypothetical protein